MDESDFIAELQKRAKDQEKIIKDMPFPKIFSAVSHWLGVHPWRFIIPLAFILSFFFRTIFGSSYTNFILGLFRDL